MHPPAKLLLVALALAGCQAPAPAPSSPAAQVPHARGVLSVNLVWPRRQTQVIPISTNTLRLQVFKDGSLQTQRLMPRPDGEAGSLAASESLQVEAATYTVLAEAFTTSPIKPGDLPIASASVSAVEVRPNQISPVHLSLVPVFTPTLTDFSPKNGGAGTRVTLVGTFGATPYLGLRISGLTSVGEGEATTLQAVIPDGAATGPLAAMADGVPSAPGGVFQVLSSLSVSPLAGICPMNQTRQFSVPTGLDTSGLSVSNPTISRWEVLDPERLNAPNPTSGVGSISPTGLFTPLTSGTAWIRARSGYLSATASITVP